MRDRCPNCPRDFDPIAGSGPSPSPFLFLGERPVRTDNDKGRVFAGKPGEELDYTYLPLARLRRPDVTVENTVRCWALGNRQPTDKEVESCANHFLPGILDRCKPEVVVLLGGTAHKIVDTPPGGRRLRVDMTHGRPVWGSLLGGVWEGWLWSSYHPALGMHDTGKMSDLLEDFEKLGEWMRGEWSPPRPAEEGRKDYGLIGSRNDLQAYLRSEYECYSRRVSSRTLRVRVYSDTERHGPAPWSLQFSLNPHSARMLRYLPNVETAELFYEFSRWLHQAGAEVVLHYAGQDLDAMERMGVYAPFFSDTMGDAFNLSLPQGLKTLAYRMLGVTMRSWEDVVWPASVEAVSDWMVEAVEASRVNLGDVKTTYMVTYTCAECGHKAHQGKKCKSKAGGRETPCGCDKGEKFSNAKYERRPGAAEKVLRHVLTHTQQGVTQDADEPYHPWKKLKEMREEGLRGAVAEGWEWDWIEETVGVMPILGIGNVPLGEAVEYGCSDADHTGQVETVLEERRGDRRWKVDEEDWDV